ncbi:MAG: RNA pseudouridine synthase [Treponema sp.]|jgi:23S rRNA pseudouridine1911/1915/1917 synthase|nr:RNA pseudouridine synthase [Treponema sp.]
MRTALEDRILLINGGVIAVNKLAGEAVEGAGRGMTDLPALLRERFGCAGTYAPAAVHRLDVPVTGCVLFARTPGTAAFLGSAFSRTGAAGVEKIYWAAAELSREFFRLPPRGELRHRIRINAGLNKSAALDGAGSRGREALLRYRILGLGKTCGFLEIDLVTGRRHQIRAQLAALGIHIKGDLKYGAKRGEKNGGIRLHARSLRFPDPSSPERLLRIAADPPRMDNLWESFAAAAAPV